MSSKTNIRILLTLYRQKCHSLYHQFINNPPPGFTYFTLDEFTPHNIFTGPVNLVSKLQRNFLINRIAQKHQIDLIYSCGGQLLISTKKPWIVDLEHVTDFVSHQFHSWYIYKHLLPTILNQNTLRFIIPWTQAGAKSITTNLHLSQSTKHKIQPVQLCRPYIPTVKNQPHQKDNSILFVSSVNKDSDKEFYLKGGHILVEIIKYSLQRKLNATFVIRSNLPPKYAYITKFPNVKVFQNILEENEFHTFFSKQRIFLFPTYQSPGLAIIDALQHGLPVITSNIFSNSEMVKDGINGYLINHPHSLSTFWLSKYGIEGIPSGRYASQDTIPDTLVRNYYQKIKHLLSHPKLLDQMGNESSSIYHKYYTLDHRNQLLKKIYEQAIAGI